VQYDLARVPSRSRLESDSHPGMAIRIAGVVLGLHGVGEREEGDRSGRTGSDGVNGAGMKPIGGYG